MNCLEPSAASLKVEMQVEPNLDGWLALLNGLEVGGDDATALLDHLRALMGGDLDAARHWLHTDNLDFVCSPFAAIAGSAELLGVATTSRVIASRTDQRCSRSVRFRLILHRLT